MRRAFIAWLALGLFGSAVYAEPPALQPGLYEVRLQTSFADGQSAAPINTVQRCVSATEIAAPQRLAPQFSGGADCSLSDLRAESNQASWTLTCRGEPAMRGNANVSWSASGYAGETRMTLQRGAEQMQMTQSYTARRLGDC